MQETGHRDDVLKPYLCNHKHIKDYSVWKANLAEILDKYENKWQDMQDPYSYSDFTEICFENTYNKKPAYDISGITGGPLIS